MNGENILSKDDNDSDTGDSLFSTSIDSSDDCNSKYNHHDREESTNINQQQTKSSSSLSLPNNQIIIADTTRVHHENPLDSTGYKCKTTPSLISVRLSLPNKELVGQHIQKNNDQDRNDNPTEQTLGVTDFNETKYDRQTWEALCKKWGMVVVREMKYVQRDFWDSSDTYEDAHKQQHGTTNNNVTEVVNGCRVEKLYDRLVVFHLSSGSGDDDLYPGQMAGLRVDDIIQTVNGIDNPGINTLFDFMKESITLLITIERRESKQQMNTRIRDDELICTTMTKKASTNLPAAAADDDDDDVTAEARNLVGRGSRTNDGASTENDKSAKLTSTFPKEKGIYTRDFWTFPLTRKINWAEPMFNSDTSKPVSIDGNGCNHDDGFNSSHNVTSLPIEPKEQLPGEGNAVELGSGEGSGSAAATTATATAIEIGIDHRNQGRESHKSVANEHKTIENGQCKKKVANQGSSKTFPLPMIKARTKFSLKKFQDLFPKLSIPKGFTIGVLTAGRRSTYYHQKTKLNFSHRVMAPLIEEFASNQTFSAKDIAKEINYETKLIQLVATSITDGPQLKQNKEGGLGGERDERNTTDIHSPSKKRSKVAASSPLLNANGKKSIAEKESRNSLLDRRIESMVRQRHDDPSLNDNISNCQGAEKNNTKSEKERRIESVVKNRQNDSCADDGMGNRKIAKESVTKSQSNVVIDLVNNREPKNMRGEKSITRTSIVRTRGVTVASTSSKAGLSLVKSTKLKRLWPDSSVFSKRIMKWSPPDVVCLESGDIRFRGGINAKVVKKPLNKIPSSFKDTSDIIKKLTPHILEEGLMSAHQEFAENSTAEGTWRRKTLVLDLQSCTPVEPRTDATTVRTYEFSFRVKEGPFASKNNLGELFVLYSTTWKQSGCVLGFIGSTRDWSSTFLTDQQLDEEGELDLFKLRICVVEALQKDVKDIGWLAERDLPAKNPDGSIPPQKMYAMNIGTSTDMMRQYEGLKSLSSIKPNLQRAIFSNPEDKTYSNKPSEGISACLKIKPPSAVPQGVWKHLISTMNAAQLSAIEKVMAGKVRENVALLQGPPGTGKTSTIVGLVSALLNAPVPAYGGKSAGTRVRVGRAISQSGGLHNNVVSHRVLVCAPSNQAVDELVWRLHKGCIGPKGNMGEFNMVRFGLGPGEERHDGRGKMKGKHEKSFCNFEREEYLNRINLDNIVQDIARGKDVNDFAFSEEYKADTKDKHEKRKSRFVNFSVERQKILSRCHVVCCTLSGAGSKAFAEAVSRDEFPQSEFDAVIVDEACQTSEASCLIPFKYNPNVVILVGDQQQLPAVTFSRDAERCLANRSLFERIYENGWPVDLIRIQYRMHDAIVKFPSSAFYGGQLVTGDAVIDRQPAVWHRHERGLFPPYLMWNISSGLVNRSANGGSSNRAEGNFIKRLCTVLSTQCMGKRGISIGIIAFYNEQVALLKNLLSEGPIKEWLASSRISIQISTVDKFQGSEKDIIILSCVKSNTTGRNNGSRQHQQNDHNIGFLRDYRRVNVALTRARHSLWVICNCNYLRTDSLWNDLIADAESRQLVACPTLLYEYETRHKIRKPGHKNLQGRAKEGKGGKKRKR